MSKHRKEAEIKPKKKPGIKPGNIGRNFDL